VRSERGEVYARTYPPDDWATPTPVEHALDFVGALGVTKVGRKKICVICEICGFAVVDHVAWRISAACWWTRKRGTSPVEASTGYRNPIGFQGALESATKILSMNPSGELEPVITALLCSSVANGFCRCV
jgi:hypothetical protein